MAQVTAAERGRSDSARVIRSALGRVDRRLRASAVFGGLGAALLVGAAGLAALMAVDFAAGLPRWARLAAWPAWVAAWLWPLSAGLRRGLAPPGRSASRALGLAAVVERADPGLGERLTGAVGLAGGPASATPHGSPELIAALADDAARRVARVDPALVAPTGPAGRRLAAGLGVAVLLAATSALAPDPVGSLARRALAPWSDLGRVGWEVVAVEPGDAVVGLGDDLAVHARVTPRLRRGAVPGEVWLEWAPAGGRTRRVAMDPAGDESGGGRSFDASLRGVAGPLAYRVVSRSGESPRYRVKAVAPPAVASVSARVEPPPYTNLPAEDARDPALIEAWEGSRVTLTVTTDAPVAEARVVWPGAGLSGPKETEAVVAPGGRGAAALLTADASGEYAVTLRDADGVRSRSGPARRLKVRADAPPVVTLRGVRDEDEARPDDTLRVGVIAADDLAVASVELRYEVARVPGSSPGAGPDRGEVAAAFAGLGTPSAAGDLALGLRGLGLAPGDVVTYRVRVADSRPAPGGPNVTWSEPRRLTVVAKADPLWARRGKAGREALQNAIESLKRDAAENRREAEQLRYAADAAGRGNGAWTENRQEALSRRVEAAEGLVGALDELARNAAEDLSFRPLAKTAEALADVEAEAAREALADARRATDDAGRLDALRRADARLGVVGSRLDELLREFLGLADREADRGRLQALADREAELGALAGELGRGDQAPDRARLDQAEAEQNALRNELDGLLKASPSLRADLLAAQAAEAEALADRARAVAARQRDEARASTAAPAADELRALVEEQRRVEADARRLALDVDAPLAEDGRGGLNLNPVREAAAAVGRGDLAQGRAQLQAAGDEFRRLAREIEGVGSDPKSRARRLARLEDQVAQDVGPALGDARNKPGVPEARRPALAAALKPLADRQREIAGTAASLPNAAKAAEAASRAAGALAEPKSPAEAERLVQASKAALTRLANDLPDVARREEPARRAFAEARRDADEATVASHRALWDTERGELPRKAEAAAEFARRTEPLAGRARRAADRIDAVRGAPRAAPQLALASARLRELAVALDAARQAAKAPSFDVARDRAARAAVDQAATAATAAIGRLYSKLHGGTPDDDLADEVAADQQALADRPAPAAAGPGVGDQRRVATALRNLEAADAPLEQAEAVRLAERAAAGDDPAAPRLAAEAARGLADRMNGRQSPRDRAGLLARAERALSDPALAATPTETLRLQRLVAGALAGLPAAGPEAEAAAEAIRRAFDLDEGVAAAPPHEARPDPAGRAEAHARAADALDALAAVLPDAPAVGQAAAPAPAVAPSLPPDPGLAVTPGHADRAMELARRERRLQERFLSILSGRAAAQADLRREAAEVGRALADLRDRARGVSERSQLPALVAEAALGDQAPRAMDEAVSELARGRPAPARDAQRRAAEAVERGAQQADDLAEALRADRPAPGSAPAAGAPEAGLLADAREAAAEAALDLARARDPSKTREALAAAATAALAASERLGTAAATAGPLAGPSPGQGQGEGPPAGAPAVGSAEPTGAPAGSSAAAAAGDPRPPARRPPGRAWGELPGHLQTELLDAAGGRYRDEYARLIQLYFREIAGGAPPPPPRP